MTGFRQWRATVDGKLTVSDEKGNFHHVEEEENADD